MTDGERPLLSVVVPVYNQAETIVENVRAIREQIEAGLDGPIEVIVVSDGSVDASSERLLDDRSHRARVIHYDRNLGKGYAVKAGALAAAGEYIAYVDADLDLDPGAIPHFLSTAREEDLDFVIGSKRHPASLVDYPGSRRVASWLYQQLVRLLFRLEVSDTQVGLKVFRREVAEQVFPALLVKQFAFDLELLAVANEFGFGRIREEPITLRYRFTGSGVRSAAVALALVDTAAIFYRLRVLRYYQRKRRFLPRATRARSDWPTVAVVATDPPAAAYPLLETIRLEADTPETRLEAARQTNADVLAFLAPGATPAANWLESTVPFLLRPEVAAVVAPTMTPAEGSARERAAGAVWESRLGGGSLHFRFTPGNLRFVDLFPAASVVVRRDSLLELDAQSASEHHLVAALNALGMRVVYTPETVIVRAEPPLFRAHLAKVAESARGRGYEVRRRGPRALRPLTLAPTALLAFAVATPALVGGGGRGRRLAGAIWAGYVATVATGSMTAGLRFRSARVGAFTALGSVATHATYGIAFVGGFARGTPPS